MQSPNPKINQKDSFPFTKKKTASLFLIISLLCSAFFAAGISYAQSGIGNQKYPTAYNNGGPSGAYDSLIFTFTNNTDTYYAAKDSFGRILDSWTSTNQTSVEQNVVSALGSTGTIILNGVAWTGNIALTGNVTAIQNYQGQKIYTANGRANGYNQIPALTQIDYASNLPKINYTYIKNDAGRFENITMWAAGAGATAAANTTYFQEGTQAVTVMSTSAGTTGSLSYSFASTPIDLTNREFQVKAYIDDVTKINQLIFYFGSGATFTSNLYRYTLAASSLRLDNGWNTISFTTPNMFIATGSPNWTAITGVRLTVVAATEGVPATVTFDDYKMYLQEYKGKVMFRFDGSGNQTFLTAYPIMSKYNFIGTVPVVTSHIGTSQWYMTLPQLRILQNAGWEICSHTVTHPDLTSVSVGVAEYEIAESQQWLLQNGFRDGARFFVAPSHDANPTVFSLIQRYYVGGSVYNRGGGYQSLSFNGDEKYNLKFLYGTPDSGSWNWNLLQSYIDTAIASNTLAMFHVNSAYVDPVVFETMCRYLYDNNIEVVTYRNLFDSLADSNNRLESTITVTVANAEDVPHLLAGTPYSVQLTWANSSRIVTWDIANTNSTSFRVAVTDLDGTPVATDDTYIVATAKFKP